LQVQLLLLSLRQGNGITEGICCSIFASLLSIAASPLPDIAPGQSTNENV
jgi:hypothetical protein